MSRVSNKDIDLKFMTLRNILFNFVVSNILCQMQTEIFFPPQAMKAFEPFQY